MALFGNDNDSVDYEKDAPKKTGVRLGLSTVWRELISLITLNFLFDLFLLPVGLCVLLFALIDDFTVFFIVSSVLILLTVLTLPAAVTAMSRITVTMVRDENFFLWTDFWKAWKENFGKSLAGGIILSVALGLLALSFFVYSQIFGTSFLMVIIGAFAACLVIIAVTASFYFWPMTALMDLPLKALLKNSLILVFGNWKRSIRCLLTVLLAVLIVLLWPVDGYDFLLLIILMIGFSLYSLCQSFAVYPAIDEKVIRKAEGKAKSLATELHSGEGLSWDEPEELKSASIADLDFGDDEENSN